MFPFHHHSIIDNKYNYSNTRTRRYNDSYNDNYNNSYGHSDSDSDSDYIESKRRRSRNNMKSNSTNTNNTNNANRNANSNSNSNSHILQKKSIHNTGTRRIMNHNNNMDHDSDESDIDSGILQSSPGSNSDSDFLLSPLPLFDRTNTSNNNNNNNNNHQNKHNHSSIESERRRYPYYTSSTQNQKEKGEKSKLNLKLKSRNAKGGSNCTAMTAATSVITEDSYYTFISTGTGTSIGASTGAGADFRTANNSSARTRSKKGSRNRNPSRNTSSSGSSNRSSHHKRRHQKSNKKKPFSKKKTPSKTPFRQTSISELKSTFTSRLPSKLRIKTSGPDSKIAIGMNSSIISTNGTIGTNSTMWTVGSGSFEETEASKECHGAEPEHGNGNGHEHGHGHGHEQIREDEPELEQYRDKSFINSTAAHDLNGTYDGANNTYGSHKESLSRQDNFDTTACLLPSISQGQAQGYEQGLGLVRRGNSSISISTPLLSSPPSSSSSPSSSLLPSSNCDSNNSNSTSNPLWDTVKKIFGGNNNTNNNANNKSKNNNNNNNNNILVSVSTPSASATASSSSSNHHNYHCVFPNILGCTKSVDSPETPEYEKRCKIINEDISNSKENLMSALVSEPVLGLESELQSQSQSQSFSEPHSESRLRQSDLTTRTMIIDKNEEPPMTAKKKINVGTNRDGINENGNSIEDEAHDHCQSFVKTVKKKNINRHRYDDDNDDHNNNYDDEDNNQRFVKTVKKKNGFTPGTISVSSIAGSPTSQRQSYVIMDETHRDIDMIPLYKANENTANFIESKECFYSGYDGKRNHYTYVSPKKDSGLPDELDDIVSDLNNPKTISSPTPSTTGKKLDFKSPELEKATTVVHVVPPKDVNSNVCDGNDVDTNLKNCVSVDGSSVSMVSGERRIVNDYLQNAEHTFYWKREEKKEDLLADSEEIDKRLQSQYQQSNKSNIDDKEQPTFRPPFVRTRSKKKVTSSSYFDHQHDDDDMTVQTMGTVGTMGTMGTNGTRHRRRQRSTSTFTADSLKQIFELDTQQKHGRELKISSSYKIVPKTISNMSNEYKENMNDDQSLISPLADDDDNKSFFRLDDPKLENSLHDEWSNNTRIAKEVVLPPEPSGIYMPKSSAFKEDIDNGYGDCCLEGWLAFSKGSRLIDSLKEDEENISRKDLRYIVIERTFLYVYTSKKARKNDLDSSMIEDGNNANSVKILNLSKDMKVEMNFVSKRHGHYISIIDSNTSRPACTLLPVRLSSDFFRDEECSQVVGTKKFKNIRTQLFGTDINVGRKVDLLKDVSNHDNVAGNESSPKPPTNAVSEALWPSTMPQIAPEEQNTTSLCLRFALDAASHK